MSARENILKRLRAAQKPFTAVTPIEERRHVVPLPALDAAERCAQFMREARQLGCFVYEVSQNEALEQVMDLLAGDTTVMAWQAEQLPMPDLPALLATLGVTIGRPDDGEIRVGLTGVSAALAATGSLVLESGAGRYRGASLLPDLHIALLKPEQILPDLETWQAEQQQRGYPAFTRASNTVIVTGPSKTADIGHELVKGAHGPRELHIMLLRE